MTFPLQSGDKLLKTNWVVLVTFPLQSGDKSHWKRNKPFWWHSHYNLVRSCWKRIESFWWHSHFNLVTQAIENGTSRSGDIPITIWWQRQMRTEWVILVIFPLQSGDTSHWKRIESFWWHSHYNLVTGAMENGMSRSDDTLITTGNTCHWKRSEAFWWHFITIWRHKPLKTHWVVLVTLPLQSGDTSHWKRNESFWWQSLYTLVTATNKKWNESFWWHSH